jgi:hypothetical protein
VQYSPSLFDGEFSDPSKWLFLDMRQDGSSIGRQFGAKLWPARPVRKLMPCTQIGSAACSWVGQRCGAQVRPSHQE